MTILENNTTKQTIINRIKIATPIMMGMFTLLSERLFFKQTVKIFSFEWFYIILAWFIINTLMLSALIYNYHLLNHSCKNCLTKWSLVKKNTISISNSILRINLIMKLLLFKIDKKFQTYFCIKCNNIQHKPSKRISLIAIEGFNSKNS
jgi:hypothetical protein